MLVLCNALLSALFVIFTYDTNIILLITSRGVKLSNVYDACRCVTRHNKSETAST